MRLLSLIVLLLCLSSHALCQTWSDTKAVRSTSGGTNDNVVVWDSVTRYVKDTGLSVSSITNATSWVTVHSNAVQYMEGRTGVWDTATAWVGSHSNNVQYMETRTTYWDTAWTLIDGYAESITNIFGWTNLWNESSAWVTAHSNAVQYMEGRTNAWNTAAFESYWASNHIGNLEACSREPMGICWDVKDKATLSFTNANRIFAITGSSAWTYWHNGTPVTKTNDTITISTNIGAHYIYYDDATGTLKESVTPWNFSNNVQVAIVYWDQVEGTLGDERHGMTMDWRTHEYLHDTIGTRFESGFSGSFGVGFITNGAGTIHDEDLQFYSTQQTNCSLIYHTNGVLNVRAGYNVPYLTNSAGVILYDTGTTTNIVAAGEYVACWIFAANVAASPIMSVMGQRVDSSLANARANNSLSGLLTGNLPLPEMKILYRLIYHRQSGVGTLIYDEAQDLRSVSAVPSSTYVPTSHASLSGLLNDDHTQYLLANGTRSMSGPLMMAGNTVSNANIEATNVVMRGNISLNGNWLSGDGGNEGVYVSASGMVGINTNTPQVHLHLVAETNTLTAGASPIIIDSYGGQFNVFSGITFRKARGTLASPSAIQSGDSVFSFGGRGYGSTGFSSGGRVQAGGVTDETWTDSDQGASLTITTTPTNSTSQNTRFRFTGAGNFQINANNGNLVPATISGSVTYFVTNATSARALVKRGDGTVTLISPHNDAGEYVADSWNTFSGVHEVANITKLAQAVESLLPQAHPLKGQIYSVVTNAPTEDWRESEAKQEVTVQKAQQRWTPDDGAFPAPYVKRPIPSWAATAQKIYDAKYVEAEK